MSDQSIHPEALAGDPFPAAAPEGQDHPHACLDGYVYIGTTDEEGEEVIEAVPCHRCSIHPTS